MDYHQPVLVQEVMVALDVKSGGRYIDATLGDGGHTLELLKRGGVVLGIDVNEGSINRARGRIQGAGLAGNFTYCRGNFKNIAELARDRGFNQVNGIVFDLGTSMTQLKDDRLGLNFTSEHELDMRLDARDSVKAFDLINGLYENELAELFWEYGEEKMAKSFAREIVKARELERITTAKQLSDVAKKSFPGYEKGRLHPATRIFLALRIAVNNELENLKSALPRAGCLLLPGGRMAVISFHSLEDRIVKEFVQDTQPTKDGLLLTELTKKPIEPSNIELARNPSSRSAKMRVVVRAHRS